MWWELTVCGSASNSWIDVFLREEAVPKNDPKAPIMHLVVVACGNRFAETLILLKSAVLLTRAKIIFHIFADDDLRPQFKKKVSGHLSCCEV